VDPLWKRLGRVVVERSPRLLREVLDPAAGTPDGRRAAGRRVHRENTDRLPRQAASDDRARRIVYAPALDGLADPGEIVWTWVPFEQDASRGKDRPLLVVGRDGTGLLGLVLSSRASHDGSPDWLALGSGAWDGASRDSWVRLDRVLEVDEDGIRREGAVLDRARFDRVAARLRTEHGWS